VLKGVSKTDEVNMYHKPSNDNDSNAGLRRVAILSLLLFVCKVTILPDLPWWIVGSPIFALLLTAYLIHVVRSAMKP